MRIVCAHPSSCLLLLSAASSPQRSITPRCSLYVKELRPGESLEAILGVPPNATPREIKVAFRRRALVTHPDVNPSSGAEAEFRRLVSAHTILSDPSKREAWYAQRKHKAWRGATTTRAEPSRAERWRPAVAYIAYMYVAWAAVLALLQPR